MCFRGPNIFSGYLNEEKKTKQVLTGDGWFITGDLGYVNKEGFLFIEGRLSRFSKIGGEMVPHGTVEDSIKKVFATKLKEEPQLAILGRQDKIKGEQLILFTEEKINQTELRIGLTEAGLPNLWIPKETKYLFYPLAASDELSSSSINLLTGLPVASGIVACAPRAVAPPSSLPRIDPVSVLEKRSPPA